jgi:hypothetical protein
VSFVLDVVLTNVGTVLSAAAEPTTSPSGGPGAGVCPSLPGQLQTYADLVLSWAKGLFLAALPVSALACLLVVLLGKIFHSPRAGQLGAVGLGVVLAVAIGYGVIAGIISAIVGSGC